MSNMLTLEASGSGGCTPDQNPWKPTKGGSVTIKNNSGFDQILSNITPGLLNPVGASKSITVTTTQDWNGTVGSTRGTYTYNDGLAEEDPRNGTIDPS